jgi:hypothetical protein
MLIFGAEKWMFISHAIGQRKFDDGAFFDQSNVYSWLFYRSNLALVS